MSDTTVASPVPALPYELPAELLIDGAATVAAQAGTFHTIEREWGAETTIVVRLPLRARLTLVTYGIVTEEEDTVVQRVLKAAAMTYVAETLTAVLRLLYFVMRTALLGRSRDEWRCRSS